MHTVVNLLSIAFDFFFVIDLNFFSLGLVYDDLLIENQDVVKAIARADSNAIAGR
jgi:hypothetical protein